MQTVLQTRLLEKSIPEPMTGCWLWIGRRNRDDYGCIDLKIGDDRPRPFLAHRISYEAFRSAIPEGLTIDHLCKTEACINPDHLEPVTIGVNVKRGNTFAAVNVAKIVCVNGHPFDEANTYRWTDRKTGRSHRGCVACRGVSHAK
jgi:hypothetical protein